MLACQLVTLILTGGEAGSQLLALLLQGRQPAAQLLRLLLLFLQFILRSMTHVVQTFTVDEDQVIDIATSSSSAIHNEGFSLF